MNIIDRQNDKHGNGNELSGSGSNEGTAARTRPLSFTEVMLRRRNKKLIAEAEEAVEPRVLSTEVDTERPSDHAGFGGGYEVMKDSKDSVKGSLKRKEEIRSHKERGHFKDRHKGRHDLEVGMKVKSGFDISRDKERKNEKQSHNRRKMNDQSKADFEKDSENKRSQGAAAKHKNDERDEKSRQENKRKHNSGSGEKIRSEISGSILKKHDSGRRQDIEYSLRKDRKYGESKSKKRRSRSRENDHDRERSVSPKAAKRSYRGHDNGELSLHSFKDRSGRQYSDVDKYRAPGNGGFENVRSWRHGSGLGGYSPRKRKTESAVKTPSPTIRSPDRKGTTWDQPPTGKNYGGSGSLFGNLQSSTTSVHEFSSFIPITSIPMKTQSTPLPNTAPKMLNTSTDSVQLTQATCLMRRLYLENLPVSATDKAVVECLNGFLLSLGSNHNRGTQPCINCITNKEKCQAVVEFLTPEDATMALSFDGRSFSGSVLKIRRPKDFVETAVPDFQTIDFFMQTGDLEKPVPVVDAISDVVKGSPHKIFVGGISKSLSSDMLLEIAGAFGHLKSFHFEFNVELNGPCAFLEYVDQSITLRACAGLNGLKLAGNILTVVKALSGASQDEEHAESPPSYDIPEHAKPLLEISTQVLKIKNVFNREELLLLSVPELEETLEDIRLECARFGTVKTINIVRNFSSYETAPEDPETDSKQNGGVTLVNYVTKEPEGVREVLGNAVVNDENSMKDIEKKESNDPSEEDRDATHEGPPQLDSTGDPSADYQKVADMKVEEGSSMENCFVPEVLKAADFNSESKEHSSESNITTLEKAEMSNEDGKCQTSDLDVFEPGCVLVEFLREEATCMAAHCLNGRLYDGRVVMACYVAHDVYLARFPN